MEWVSNAYAVFGLVCLVVLIGGLTVFYALSASRLIDQIKRERAAEERETRKDIAIENLKKEVARWALIAEERKTLIDDLRKNEKNRE